MCDHGRGLDGRLVMRGRHRRKQYKQGWADEGAGRQASRRPKSSQNFSSCNLKLLIDIDTS